MAAEMSRADALKLLKLDSPLELNVGHVQKMIDADPQALENIYVESAYWDAFHVLKQERDGFLAKEWEANRIKDEAKAKRELNSKSLIKSFEQQKNNDPFVGYKNEMRRELGDLVYEINHSKQLENQFLEENKELEKRKQALVKIVNYQRAKDDENINITESILDLEKKIASINNDKSGTISPEVKSITISKLKRDVVDLKSKRSLKNPLERELFLCQQALLIQESVCEDIKLKIEKSKIKLLEYTETVRIYSLVETNEHTYFIGPFSGSRAIAGVNYASGFGELGKALKGMKKGETAIYNGQSLEILNIRIPDSRWLQGLVTPVNWEEDYLTVLPDWSPLGWDLRDRTKRPELWSRSPGFSNNSRHLER